eukprot:7379547-Prymnesium_polylepis.2
MSCFFPAIPSEASCSLVCQAPSSCAPAALAPKSNRPHTTERRATIALNAAGSTGTLAVALAASDPSTAISPGEQTLVAKRTPQSKTLVIALVVAVVSSALSWMNAALLGVWPI